MSDLIPDGWELGKFSSLATVQNGYAFKSSDFIEHSDIAVIRMSNLKTGQIDLSNAKYVAFNTVNKLTEFKVSDGDFLFGMSGSLDNYAWVSESNTNCYLNQRVGCLKPSIGANYKYSSYSFLSEFVRQEISMLAAGAAQLNISGKQLESIDVVIPPLPEQQKIAAILTSVDEVIEKTQAQIDKLKDLKTGMMQSLLTCGVGIDGKPHTEFKDSPVGRIPKGWECVYLESLLKESKNSMRSGPFGSALLKHELVPIGSPYLGIDNVHIERFENKFKRFVSDEKFEQLKKYAVKEDDVMITIMGTVGRSCVVPKGLGKALSSKHVWTMTFDTNKYIPTLICWQLNYSNWVKLQFKNESQGGVMESISSKTLKSLWLPVPPLDEQQKMNAIHKSLSNTINIKENLLCKHKDLKKALMQDLLTGKVRVTVPSETGGH